MRLAELQGQGWPAVALDAALGNSSAQPHDNDKRADEAVKAPFGAKVQPRRLDGDPLLPPPKTVKEPL